MLKNLDEFLPEYEFSERHAVRVRASAARVDAALRELSIEDLRLVDLLMRMRMFGRRRSARRPFIEQMSRLDDAPREGVVLGLKGDFWRLRPRRGESCEAVFDFRISGDVLSTETRVHVADPAARRRFARYWRVIRPFSGLTRVLILREVRRRAEA